MIEGIGQGGYARPKKPPYPATLGAAGSSVADRRRLVRSTFHQRARGNATHTRTGGRSASPSHHGRKSNPVTLTEKGKPALVTPRLTGQGALQEGGLGISCPSLPPPSRPSRWIPLLSLALTPPGPRSTEGAQMPPPELSWPRKSVIRRWNGNPPFAHALDTASRALRACYE